MLAAIKAAIGNEVPREFFQATADNELEGQAMYQEHKVNQEMNGADTA